MLLSLFSCSLMFNSLQPHKLKHTRLPCPSLSPGVCLNSCPLSWWCHPTIPSSVTTFSSCPQSFPASGSFPLRQLFTSGAQSIGAHGHGDFLSLPLSVCSSHTSLLTAFSPPEEGTAAAAAAKSLQSCPTLCDPIGGSPPAVFPWGLCTQNGKTGSERLSCPRPSCLELMEPGSKTRSGSPHVLYLFIQPHCINA